MKEKIIIIWSWPAWHTAWIYAWRAMLEPIMFEWNMAWWVSAWWQLTTTNEVENFPWFPTWIDWKELMERMREQSINSWVKIFTETVDKVDISKRPFKVFVWDKEYETETLLISTWATARRLRIIWEEEYWQKWISACAICDWALPIFRNKELWVVWWWDSAIEEALHLTKYASKVYLFVRSEKLRASKVMQQRAMNNDKIEIVWNSEIVEAIWDMILRKIIVLNNKENKKYEMEIWWLFYAIGHTPNTGFLEWQLELDETWYIITKKWTTETSVPWVFAAWDVQDKKYRQAITSAWTWAMAAIEIEKFLEDNK